METVCVCTNAAGAAGAPLGNGDKAGIAHPGGATHPNPPLRGVGGCPGQDPTAGTAPGVLQCQGSHGLLWGPVAPKGPTLQGVLRFPEVPQFRGSHGQHWGSHSTRSTPGRAGGVPQSRGSHGQHRGLAGTAQSPAVPGGPTAPGIPRAGLGVPQHRVSHSARGPATPWGSHSLEGVPGRAGSPPVPAGARARAATPLPSACADPRAPAPASAARCRR